MSNFRVRAAVFAVVIALGASACASDAAGSPQTAQRAATETPVDDGSPVTTTTQTALPSTADDVSSESLPFLDSDEPVGQQLWTDIESVSFTAMFDFELDGSVEIDGNYTAGEGLVARWSDAVDGDVLAVVQDGETSMAFRVGNEVFIDEAGESPRVQFALTSLIAEILEPLGGAELPPVGSTFVESSAGISETSDVLYQLVEGSSDGDILLAGEPFLNVIDDAPDGGFEVPESGVMLTREQVGRTVNPVFRSWYLDQAG